MTTIVWADGQIVEPNTPVITALDRGYTVGHGVFETLAVVNGVPFALTRHLARLARSGQIVGVPVPQPDQLRAIIDDVLAAWAFQVPANTRGRLRITATAGPAAMGVAPVADSAPGHLTVVLGPAPVTDDQRVGIAAVRVPWARNARSPLAGAKSTSYAENAMATNFALQAGADEALIGTTDGELCEGATSNVFVEVGGELLTPPLSTGCLAGVTRALVLEWGAAAGVPVREAAVGELPISILDDAAHLAVTGSVKGIRPVVILDGAARQVGPLTAAISEVYQQRAALEVDP